MNPTKILESMQDLILLEIKKDPKYALALPKALLRIQPIYIETALALDSTLDFTDMLVDSDSIKHVAQVYDAIEAKLKKDPKYILTLPKLAHVNPKWLAIAFMADNSIPLSELCDSGNLAEAIFLEIHKLRQWEPRKIKDFGELATLLIYVEHCKIMKCLDYFPELVHSRYELKLALEYNRSAYLIYISNCGFFNERQVIFGALKYDQNVYLELSKDLARQPEVISIMTDLLTNVTCKQVIIKLMKFAPELYVKLDKKFYDDIDVIRAVSRHYFEDLPPLTAATLYYKFQSFYTEK